MIPTALDHLVYVVPDLAAAIAALERLLGVRPGLGGQHLGRGTRNALLALGPTSYLEVIGPDPEQPPPARPRPFGMDRLSAPKLVTWAARVEEIDARVAAALAVGFDLGDVQSMSRTRPDGLRLEWRLTYRRDPLPADGLAPFLIAWGDTPHPAATAPPGCTLVALRGEHPDPPAVQALLAAVGAELEVGPGPAPLLIATLATPNGAVELR